MSVIAVVLTWNNYYDTAECLKSLRESGCIKKIICVDNGSKDGSIEKLMRDFSDVEWILSPINVGVAAGFNLGLSYAKNIPTEYILILNNDVVIGERAVKILKNFMDSNREVGLAMPKIVYYDNNTKIWSAGARLRKFPPAIVMIGFNKTDSREFNKQIQIQFAPACCIMIRKQVVIDVGLFDERHFIYFNDWDYSLRIRQSGFLLFYVPDAVVYHKGSRSVQKIRKSSFFWRSFGKSAALFYLNPKFPHRVLGLCCLGYLLLRESVFNGLSSGYYLFEGIVKGIKDAHRI
jgi:GT2 family glycosyltransferase